MMEGDSAEMKHFARSEPSRDRVVTMIKAVNRPWTIMKIGLFLSADHKSLKTKHGNSSLGSTSDMDY
jgi:hypothetical protein